MITNKFFTLVATTFFLNAALTFHPANAAQTAFVGVNVVSVENGAIVEDQTVIIEDGLITVMGPKESTSPAIDAKLIDGTGKFLMPGLADMHIHFLNQDFMNALLKKDDPIQPIENMLYLYLANGVTTVRVMAGFPEILELRDAIERGDVLGPRLIVTTPLLDGAKPIWFPPLGYPVTTADAARQTVQDAKKDGYDMIKVYTLLPRDAYDAIIDEAKKVGLKVVGHVPVAVGLEHALESGQNEITHAEEYWRFTRDYSDEVIGKFTSMTAKSGAWYSPTMTTYNDQMSDGESVMNRPENRYLDPVILDFWKTRVPPTMKTEKAKEMWAKRVNVLKDFMFRLVKGMYDAGVPLMTGTDALNPMAMPGFALHRELALFVETGIPIADTLRAATTNPAKFMSESDEWGSIASGRRADLVLLNANPLEDIGNTKTIDGVMIRGQWLEDDTIQAQLNAFAKENDDSRN